MAKRKRGTPEDRFWPKVNKHGPVPTYRPDLGPCWVWTASLSKQGYGRFGMGGQRGAIRLAHVVAYEFLVGKVPDGLELDHLCRVTSCVNPSHLEPVTRAENMRRAVEARTHCSNGHPFTDDRRRCRECNRDWRERWQQSPPAGARRVQFAVSLSETDLALIEGARGNLRRASWVRLASLTAARNGLTAPSGPNAWGSVRVRITVDVMVSDDEAALIDSARGDTPRSTWMRAAVLAAAA